MTTGPRRVIGELGRIDITCTDNLVITTTHAFDVELHELGRVDEDGCLNQEEQTGAKMESMLNDTREQVGIRGWLPGDGDPSLFGLDRTPVERPPLKPIPWWRFVRFRRWLRELIAGRDFNVE